MQFHQATEGLVAIVLATVPAICSAQVYKCQGPHGPTYQDNPCADTPGTAPYIASTAADSGPRMPDAPNLKASLDSLGAQLHVAATDQRELEDQYRRARAYFELGLHGATKAEQDKARKAFTAKWWPRIAAGYERMRAIHNEIDRRCPHGGVVDERSKTWCNK